MYLYKRLINVVDGWEGYNSTYHEFFVSDKIHIINENEITQEDVVEADVTTLDYCEYQNLGEISENEIEVLKKFKILTKE